jgi:two-component system response regulator DesR
VIRVLLAHREKLPRRALAEVLGQAEDLHVVAEVASGEQVLVVAARERPQVAVLDHRLSGNLGMSDICAGLHRAVPECVVLVVLDPDTVGSADTSLARQVPRVGLVATETSPAQLIENVRRMMRGETVLDIGIAVAALTSRGNPLTDRECEILYLAAAGAPVKDIAAQVCLSAGTVRNYLSRIVSKTGARTRIEAIRIAQRAGWI